MTNSAFCASCGSRREGDARFCTDCGETFVDPFAPPADASDTPTAANLRDAPPRPRAAPSAQDPATAQMPAAAAGHGWGATSPPPPPGDPGVYAAQPPVDPYGMAMQPQPPPYYPQPQQPAPTSNNRGLIIGLSAALFAVIAGVLVAVLITSGGTSNTPTLAATPTPTTTPTQTVTEKVVTPAPKPEAGKKRTATTSGSAGAPAASVPKVTPVPAVSKPSGPSPTVVAKVQMRKVVEQHWSDIESGAYNAAFTALVPTQSQSAWVAAHEEDALKSASISLGSPTLTSSTTATLPVNRLHTVAASGCFDWSGYYQMQKSGGSWRIEKSKLDRTSC